uniref:DUF7133 domain-containing protein n=1 Tax=Zavarzinella formosa TaxID=360055 RepID=UPI001EE6690F|nr:c-type cytochrome [Zavarzinella formosa]
MTIDEAGRVLVAGRGYVRVLVDDNGDGIADRAIDLIDGLKDGPMGLLAEGDSLYVVTNGGLQRYRGYNGKDKLKQTPETLIKLKTTGEHDAHAVRRGPDGWLYLLCGNMAGVTKQTITSPRSPVKEPVAGALLRISPDQREVEVVADGFRNPYSFDFNLDGEPFAYDSDNERCVGLPWYEPCRFYHVVTGGNHGWRSPQFGQFWRKPPYFVDCVPPVCTTGRGSPTGVACYRHTHFPEKYRGGFFLADWTFGRIHFVPMTPKDSTYAGKPEVFAEAIGTSGFAPTALAVHPKTGELFVSIGGRGTRGGIYRISHENSPVGKLLPMAKRSLDLTPEAERKLPTNSSSSWLPFPATASEQRARRYDLELLRRHGDKIAWDKAILDSVISKLCDPDPMIRLAAGRVMIGHVAKSAPLTDAQSRLTMAFMETNSDPARSIETAISVLNDKNTANGLKLQAIRIIQLALGDLTTKDAVGTVFEGYTLRRAPTPQQREAIERACEAVLSGGNPDLEVEAFRTLAGIQSQETRFAQQAIRQISADSDVRKDIGHLAVIARLGADGQSERKIADILLHLDRKATKQNLPRDTFWPLRITEIVAALGKRYPNLGSQMLNHPLFGQPEHLLFVKPLLLNEEKAARAFAEAAKKNADYGWTPGVVELLGAMPAESCRPVLLKLWERPELRDAILKALPPQEEDATRFVTGLASFDPQVVSRSAKMLEKLPRPEGVTEIVAAVKALRRLGPEDKLARATVASLLQKRTGQKLDADPKAWVEWVTKNHPETTPLFASNDGFDSVAWKQREAGIVWEKGDAERGKSVFTKASCAACHDGGRALGPSLLGISKRFGKDDLLTAILQPSKDVSPRYRPTRITTEDERVFIGVMIYEATDGVILQTNADTSVRIAGEKIASKRPVETSPMPAGLLDKLGDGEVADLFAYLKSLEEPKR